MRGKHSRASDLQVEYTSKPLSGWGGTWAFFRFTEKLHLDEYLKAGLPDGRTSPNQTTPVDIAKTLLTMVLLGGQRFAHVDRIRNDEVLRRTVGVKRLAGADSVRRYFGGFTQGQSEQLCDSTGQLSAVLQRGFGQSDILDLDSTVLDRFGDQEGSTRGYQPVHHGRKSHHPLLAMLAEGKFIAHSWLRAGSASTHKGCLQFFQETKARLPEGFQIKLLRADSGFYTTEFLELLEVEDVPYLIVMKMTQTLVRQCMGVKSWERINRFQDIGEIWYQPSHWKKPRRVIVVRRLRKPKAVAQQQELITMPVYEHHALVTNDETMGLREARALYNGRGDCENRIKELKHDFNIGGFCLSSFAGTEATFRLICFLYNLISDFRRRVLLDTKTTLGTIRTAIFVIGAQLGSSGRKQILRLGLCNRWKYEFERLLDRIANLRISTAAQLQKYLDSDDYGPPTSWHLRRHRMAMP